MPKVAAFLKGKEEKKDNAVAWTITQSGDTFVEKEDWASTESTEITSKSKAGGQRSNIVSKALDKLIEDGWLNTAKTPAEVSKELERKTIRA